jgi:hypothetical protein
MGAPSTRNGIVICEEGRAIPPRNASIPPLSQDEFPSVDHKEDQYEKLDQKLMNRTEIDYADQKVDRTNSRNWHKVGS